MQLCRRVFPDPYVELLGLNHPLFLGRAPEAQFVWTEREVNGLLGARRQIHPLKAFQLPHRTRSAPGALVNIELHDRIAGTAAGVSYVNRHIKARIRPSLEPWLVFRLSKEKVV